MGRYSRRYETAEMLWLVLVWSAAVLLWLLWAGSVVVVLEMGEVKMVVVDVQAVVAVGVLGLARAGLSQGCGSFLASPWLPRSFASLT